MYVTAPNWSQALGLTFKEIKTMRRENHLPGVILDSGTIRDEDKILAGKHFIKALNAESGEGFQGEHAAPILQIYEEAVGVPPYIWEAGRGLMTHPDCRLLAIGNPTNEATVFGQSCSSPNYNVITINGLSHPNILAELSGQPAPFPKAVRLTWVQEMLAENCEIVPTIEGDAFEFPPASSVYYLPNAVFQGRVLGEFPSQADEQVIPRGWLRNLPLLSLCTVFQVGCDIARHGSDRTVIAVRCGSCLLSVKEIRQMDTVIVTGALIEAVRDIELKYNIPAKSIPITIDVTGGLGAGPADFLREQGYNAIDVNSSSNAINKEAYPNVRSELWFNLRERARTKDLDFSRLSVEMRSKLERELATPTWKNNGRGQRVVEEKAFIKKRLGESPDIADGVNLAYYMPMPSVSQHSAR